MATKTLDVELAKLEVAPENVRTMHHGIEELAETIRQVGVILPLVARPGTNGTYLVTAGGRRLAAAKLLKLKTLPVIVRDEEPDKALTTSLVENLQREDLTPIEEAQSYEAIASNGLSQREMAKVVGRSQAHISKRIGLLRLPEAVQDQIASGKLSVSDGIELTPLAEEPDRIAHVMKAASAPGPFQADIRALVGRHLHDMQAQDKIAKGTEAAKAKGLVVIDPDEYEGDAREVEFIAGVSAGQHAKLDCHVVSIDDDGLTIPWCVDPSAHRPKTERAPKSTETAAQKKIREEQDHEAAVDRAKKAFVTEELMKRRVPAGDRQRVIFEALIFGCRSDEAHAACRMLGLELVRGGYGSPDAPLTLRKHAEKGQAQLADAAFAIACYVGLTNYNRQHMSFDKLLRAQGFSAPRRKGTAPAKKATTKKATPKNVTPITKARSKRKATAKRGRSSTSTGRR